MVDGWGCDFLNTPVEDFSIPFDNSLGLESISSSDHPGHIDQGAVEQIKKLTEARIDRVGSQ